MVKIGILTGSTRDSRVNSQVAEWVKSMADKRGDADYELVDIKDYNLPRFNEPIPAIMSQDYTTPEAHVWSKKINELDGFIFVTPEYNKAITSGLKDAIDYLYVEWNNKAAGIVSYGSTLGGYSNKRLTFDFKCSKSSSSWPKCCHEFVYGLPGYARIYPSVFP